MLTLPAVPSPEVLRSEQRTQTERKEKQNSIQILLAIPQLAQFLSPTKFYCLVMFEGEDFNEWIKHFG